MAPTKTTSLRQRSLRLHLFDRRYFVTWGISTATIGGLLVSPSHAMGLMQFPCRQPLSNTYHFVRAGENLMEVDGIWSTNPLFLTNREAALSPEGEKQVEAACQILQEQETSPTIVRYSLTASCIDTANIIGSQLKLGRDRLVPEFNYIDPRAVGGWDMLPLSSTQAAVWAMDVDEAGAEGKGARPPPNEDGTPHETLADQSIRLRQLLSVLETQYSGDTVVVVFPDGTGPALLSAMIAGIPFNRVHELEYAPGEIRLNVTMNSTLHFVKEKDREEYNNVIALGRKELKRLRALKADEVVSVKDQRLEQERIETEARMKVREEERIAKEQSDQLARESRYRQMREARRQRLADENGAVDGLGISTPVQLSLAAAGLGIVGASVALGGENDDGIEKIVSPDDPSPVNAATAKPRIAVADSDGEDEVKTILAPVDPSADNTTARNSYEEELNLPSIGIPETLSLDLNISSATGVSNERNVSSSSRVNGDRQASFPPTKPRSQDPVKAAEDAMNDYMDSDDGASAWLEVMTDIMREDDESSNTTAS